MNNKRKFLIPLAALASVFVAGNASANVNSNELDLASATAQIQTTAVVGSNDVFKFILKTPAQSQFMAYHSSHSSHASHASHASHSSHQSGY
jgi:hypothetical protein